jgi:hypothetical protein
VVLVLVLENYLLRVILQRKEELKRFL